MSPARAHCLAGVAAALMLTLFAAGCGGKRGFPAEGTVFFDDDKPAKELAGGTVSFESVADQSNASGQIQSDGTFRMKSQLGTDGLPAGTYRVLILPPEPDDPDRRPPPLIDPAYQRYDSSGLQVTIEAKANTIPIKIKRHRSSK